MSSSGVTILIFVYLAIGVLCAFATMRHGEEMENEAYRYFFEFDSPLISFFTKVLGFLFISLFWLILLFLPGAKK